MVSYIITSTDQNRYNCCLHARTHQKKRQRNWIVVWFGEHEQQRHSFSYKSIISINLLLGSVGLTNEIKQVLHREFILKKEYGKCTLCSSQYDGSENQLSSTTTPSFISRLYATVAIEDVKTTLLIDETLAQERSTFSVPFTAGSNSSA